MNVKDTLVTILIVVAMLVITFFVARFTSPSKTRTEIQRDTIVRIDTFVSIPEPKIVRVVDSIPVPYPVYETKTDTLLVVDTLYLPRTQKHYKEAEYEAWVSGYQPSLDSIWVYNKTSEVNTISVPSRKRWSIGVQAGYGVQLSPNGVVAAPYIGVGVTYNLFSW